MREDYFFLKHVAIIGAGISGLMAAYKLALDKNINITIYEKGNSLDTRQCPILANKVDKCIKCQRCAIMEGVAGAGAFSDGKYNITEEYGGWLQNILPHGKLLGYIEEIDQILVSFGATTHRFYPEDAFKKLCLQNGLQMLQGECKHLGTDKNVETMKNLVAGLQEFPNITLQTNTEVVDVVRDDSGDILVRTNDGKYALYNKLVFAVGRSGSSFFSRWCNNNRVKMKNNQVDIGVRVELPSEIWDDFERSIYEPKIIHRSAKYGDVTRMFCFNGRGEVVTENTNGLISVNGHAYSDSDKKTKNTNFALLSTINFTEPFSQPIEYAKHVVGLANMIADGGILVQRLGDLENGRRTNDARLAQSTVHPTLKGAVAGDLSLCLPKRQLDNIIEALHALDKVARGTANYDTLLYGVEAKYYSARPETNDDFSLVSNHNIYAIGDGAGFTRSLAQAGAHGYIVAENILKYYNGGL